MLTEKERESEREGEREREREKKRGIDVRNSDQLPSLHTPTGIKSDTQVCVLTKN